MQINRRSVVQLGGAALCGGAVPTSIFAASLEQEFQCGDPQAQLEKIDFDSYEASKPALSAHKASFLEKIPSFGEKLVEEAKKYVGYNRADNKSDIEDMLSVFGLKFADERGVPYAFCAAGLSYVAARTYAKNRLGGDSFGQISQCLADVNRHHFFPNPGVANMKVVNAVNGRWIDYDKEFKIGVLRPGWIVAFKWESSGHHIGIIESVSKSELKTIEFNTSIQTSNGSQRNGGAIAERSRPWNRDILGFVNVDRAVVT